MSEQNPRAVSLLCTWLLTLSYSNFLKHFTSKGRQQQRANDFPAWLCSHSAVVVSAGRWQGGAHVPAKHLSWGKRGKEREGVTGRAQCVTMERGEEGFSPESQENLKRRWTVSFKTKVASKAWKQMPTLEGCCANPLGPAFRRSRSSQLKWQLPCDL